MRRILPALVALLLALPAAAQFQPKPLSPIGQAIQAAMQSDIRTAEEKDRDAERRPIQTLEFFGLKEDQRVVELMPGGGWYTKILGPVLAGKGTLYEAVGTRQVEPMVKQYPALAKVQVLATDVKLTPATTPGLFDISPFSLGVQDVDLVVTFRNLHNFTPATRGNLHRAVFAALKSGGHYGILDHTRRHNEPDNPENWRRVDPVSVIKDVQAAGFVLEDYSAIHYIPDDELRYEVGRKTVTGNTDRFVLLFRKP